MYNTPIKPPKPTRESIAKYRGQPKKPPKPTSKSIANYRRRTRLNRLEDNNYFEPDFIPLKRIPNSVRYQGRKTNKSRNEERMNRYSRPTRPESQFNIRGKTRKEKQRVFDRMEYMLRLEKNNRERARQKELKNQVFREHFFRNGKEIENKTYRTKIRKQIGNELRIRKTMINNNPGFNVINSPVVMPASAPQRLNSNKLSEEYEKINTNQYDFRSMPNTKRKSKMLSLFSRMKPRAGKIRRTRTKRSIGGGHRLDLIEMKSLHKKRNSPIYKGLGNDMLMSYIFLLEKHKHKLCIAVGDKEKLKTDINPTYIGLVYELDKDKNKIVYNAGLDNLKKFIKECKHKYFIIPLSMEYPNSGAHFNLLVGDTKRRVIERFEPYGSVINEKVHKNFDNDFQDFIKKNELDYEYSLPGDFMPKLAFQELEETQIDDQVASMRRDDYRGYCGMWSVWFIDLKMSNPEETSKSLLAKSLKKMKKRNFRKFIRNYANHIIEVRKMVLEEIDPECKKTRDGMSPDYQLFKRCVNRFVRQKLDNYF